MRLSETLTTFSQLNDNLQKAAEAGVQVTAIPNLPATNYIGMKTIFPGKAQSCDVGSKREAACPKGTSQRIDTAIDH